MFARVARWTAFLSCCLYLFAIRGRYPFGSPHGFPKWFGFHGKTEFKGPVCVDCYVLQVFAKQNSRVGYIAIIGVMLPGTV